MPYYVLEFDADTEEVNEVVYDTDFFDYARDVAYDMSRSSAYEYVVVKSESEEDAAKGKFLLRYWNGLVNY